MARRRRPARLAPSRPLIVAHRGASAVRPEHTLDAYLEAIELGVDALECDVRLTRDGHLVCVHDRTVNRTSDGRGVVSDLRLDRLQELDFASWHTPEAADGDGYLAGVEPDRLSRHGGVLTLERLLKLVHDSGAGVRLLVETKHPTRYAGLVEKELVTLLRRFGWGGSEVEDLELALRTEPDWDSRVVVMSFAVTAVRRVKMLAPQLPTVLLLDRLSPGRLGLDPAAAVAGPSLALLRDDPGYVERAHRRGRPVYAWTVDSADDIDYVRSLGVDAIISNRPGRVIAAVDGRPKHHGPGPR